MSSRQLGAERMLSCFAGAMLVALSFFLPVFCAMPHNAYACFVFPFCLRDRRRQMDDGIYGLMF